MRQIFLRPFLFGFLVVLAPSLTEAASLYIDPPLSELNRGDAVELSVRLDVEEETDECINAVDAVITYSENIAPVDVSIGDSIFTMWVEQPKINKTDRTITFAGGMPNGYCGRVAGDPRLTNSLVKLIFRAPGFAIGNSDDIKNEASVNFTDQTTAYLNDGMGTQVTPRLFGARMQLSRSAGAGIVDPWRESVGLDNVPPEEFSIFLNRDDLAFSNKYYISFNTTDKQTGIDQYQVMEEPIENFGSFNWGRADAPWITTRSPYVLEDQSLNSTIRVKAIDKAGNEYIATLLPEESVRTISSGQLTSLALIAVIALIILGCVGVVIAFILQYLKRRRIAKTIPDENPNQIDENHDL